MIPEAVRDSLPYDAAAELATNLVVPGENRYLPTQPAGSGFIYPDPPTHARRLPGQAKLSLIVINKLERIEKVH